MVSSEKKKIKQKNSLRSGININIWLILAGLGAVAGLIHGSGGAVRAAVGIFLTCKLLKLTWRISGLVLSLAVSAVPAVILTLIILFIIF
ncbi:MAG: hypothetical protein LBE91_02595 [Tannerella sp.]|nr:hypothetical protein [Tannerella sp.]